MAKCVDCGTAVAENDPGVYREVIGFERARSQGGTNAVHIRRLTGVYLCRSCGDLRRLGKRHGGFGQQQSWDDEPLPGMR